MKLSVALDFFSLYILFYSYITVVKAISCGVKLHEKKNQVYETPPLFL